MAIRFISTAIVFTLFTTLIWAGSDSTWKCLKITPQLSLHRAIPTARGSDLLALESFHTDGGYTWANFQKFSAGPQNKIRTAKFFSDSSVNERGEQTFIDPQTQKPIFHIRSKNGTSALRMARTSKTYKLTEAKEGAIQK